MTAAMPALYAAQGGASVLDTITQYRAQGTQSKYQQTAYDINARMDRLKANDAIARGDETAGLIRRQSTMTKGEQVAGFSGQGVDVSSGTASAIQGETDQIGEHDVLVAKNNAWRTAWGLNTEADNLEAEGRMARNAGKQEQADTLATGGLRVLNTYAKFKNYQTLRPLMARARKVDAEDDSGLGVQP